MLLMLLMLHQGHDVLSPFTTQYGMSQNIQCLYASSRCYTLLWLFHGQECLDENCVVITKQLMDHVAYGFCSLDGEYNCVN